MKTTVLILLPAIVISMTVCNSLFAHHAAMQAYEDDSITLMGVVVNYQWENPHSILSVLVKTDNGDIERWHAEILPPNEMLRAGWTKRSLKFGDMVTLTGRPGKYGQHIMWLEYVITPNGRKLGRSR
jgi:hypothetical protein